MIIFKVYVYHPKNCPFLQWYGMVRYCFTHIRIVSHQWAAGKTGQQFEEEMLLPRVEAQKDLRNRCPHWLPHDLFFDVFCIILGASSEFT